ncbi:MAG TPA: DMT family transporter [Bacteroidales bacterium]|nr:DMT family transporter [Bacteroidales bacterium]
MSSKFKAHISISLASVIFGANYWIAKGLMPYFFTPLQIVFLRIVGALFLYFMLSFIFKTGNVDKQDMIRIALCGLFGVALNQILFFEGLKRTSPVDTALIHATSPLMVVLFAFILVKEKLKFKEFVGVLIGFIGTLILITDDKNISFEDNRLSGNILILLNIISYSIYLVLLKPLMKKYHPVTVMKYVFMWGFLISIPFTITSLPDINLSRLNLTAILSILYVIIGTTFLAYLLTTYSLKTLNTFIVGYYIYSQPFIAAIIGIITGVELPTINKILAGLLIFIGIYLVNQKQAVKTNLKQL